MACLTNFNIHKPINKDFNTVDFSNLIFVRGGGGSNLAYAIIQTFSQVLISS